jgi:N-formylglutamate deformylase
MLPFKITLPSSEPVPVFISVPHCGTTFPDEIKDEFDLKLIQSPDDTDWFVDQLYDFAPSLGMTMITAVYSRWVIDLNRDPQNKPLYADGRIITGLCPTATFLAEPLYKDKRTEIAASEIERRRKVYYQPYHEKVESILHDLKSKFGKVLLWDCHSIRQTVRTIQEDKFPDLILGDADGCSSSPQLIDIAINNLGSGAYSLQHNRPFKGGYITRQYGKPSAEQFALQLEMTKVNYMDDSELKYDQSRANKMREILIKTLRSLSAQLTS